MKSFKGQENALGDFRRAYSYNTDDLKILFRTLSMNIGLEALSDAILNQSEIYGNSPTGSKEEYYGYWILMKFNQWLKPNIQ